MSTDILKESKVSTVPQAATQQKWKQENADKQARIQEVMTLVANLVASTRDDEWDVELCVREPLIIKKRNRRNELVDVVEFKFHKRRARVIDEANRIYVTSHGDLVEPGKQPNGHHRPQVDTERYWLVNWFVRRSLDVDALHAALLARINTR